MNDCIKTENRTKKTPFTAWNKINRAVHHFEDNQKIKRNGKEINLQQFINENNVDCTIYDVLKRYNGDTKLTEQALNKIQHTVIDELAGIEDLRSALDIMKKSEQTWEELPIEVRKMFENDINKFQKNGAKWAKQAVDAYEKKQKEALEALQKQQEQPKNTGDVNNG